MYANYQAESHTHDTPSQIKTEAAFDSAKKTKRGNPYEGGPIHASGGLASRMKQSFSGGADRELSATGPVSVGGMNAAAAPVQMLAEEDEAPLTFVPFNFGEGTFDVSKRWNDAMASRATALMDDKLRGGDTQGAHGLMSQGYEQFMIPKMTASTQDWQSKTEGENINGALDAVFRENSTFSKANAVYTKHIYDKNIQDAVNVMNKYEKAGKHKKPMADENMDAMLLSVLQAFSKSLSDNDAAREAFALNDDALSNVPFMANNEGARRRGNLNNIVLRALNPGIVGRTASKMKVNPRGVREPKNPQQAAAQKMDLKISKHLQNSLNVYTNEGNTGTAEAPNALHNMFDSIISQLSQTKRDGPTFGPLTQSQQAMLDKWDAPATVGQEQQGTANEPPAPASKPNFFKRLFNKIRGRR